MLPINYEIDQRRMVFLHHILNLDEDDPVRKMYNNQTLLSGEKNWGNEVKSLRVKFGVTESDDEIKAMSRDSYKSKIKKAVREYAFTQLLTVCRSKSKTKDLNYDRLETQDYLTKLYPWQAELIFRCRSKTLDIKAHRPFKYEDHICRWCNLQVEEVSHIINCGEEEIEVINVNTLNKMDGPTKTKVTAMTYRIDQFIDRVDY